jgi:hypothetical protein
MPQCGKCQPNEMVNLDWLGRGGRFKHFDWTRTYRTDPTLYNSSANVMNLDLPENSIACLNRKYFRNVYLIC